MIENEVRNSPMTIGWLAYEMYGNELQLIGIYQTKEKADEDGALMAKYGKHWKVASVPFIGWGCVGPGVFGQNGPPPLKTVE